MSLPVQTYVRALTAAAGRAGADPRSIGRGLVRATRKRGDARRIPAILEAAGRVLARAEGVRLATVETARPLTRAQRYALTGALGKDTRVEERITSRLIAGVRITFDDDRALDVSLERRLRKLFSVQLTTHNP